MEKEVWAWKHQKGRRSTAMDTPGFKINICHANIILSSKEGEWAGQRRFFSKLIGITKLEIRPQRWQHGLHQLFGLQDLVWDTIRTHDHREHLSGEGIDLAIV